MFRSFPRSLKLSLVTLVAGSAIIVGAATVVQADTSGSTYYACVNNSSGTIKMVSSTQPCATNEQKYTWDQHGTTGPEGPQGPVGPQGPIGPAGPKGDPGPAGTGEASSAYVAHTGPRDFVKSTTGTGYDLKVTLDLPAGSYVVTATENAAFHADPLSGATNSGGQLTCSVTPGAARGIQGVTDPQVSDQAANLALTDTVTLESDGTVVFACDSTSAASSAGAIVTATPVKSIVEQVIPSGSLSASVDGYFDERNMSCQLSVWGENLMPGSTIKYIVDGGQQFTLGQAPTGAPVVVQADGSLNTVTSFGNPQSGATHNVTLTAETASGGTVQAGFTVAPLCPASAG